MANGGQVALGLAYAGAWAATSLLSGWVRQGLPGTAWREYCMRRYTMYRRRCCFACPVVSPPGARSAWPNPSPSGAVQGEFEWPKAWTRTTSPDALVKAG